MDLPRDPGPGGPAVTRPPLIGPQRWQRAANRFAHLENHSDRKPSADHTGGVQGRRVLCVGVMLLCGGDAPDCSNL